jgi:glutamate carboxypeptidase
VELSHKIVELEALNDTENGLLLNVGEIHGGTGPNIVPDEAVASIDVRFTEVDERTYARKKILQIAEKVSVPGTWSEVTQVTERPPMQQTEHNKELFKVVKSQADHLGIHVQEEFRKGVSDANLIAAQEAPVVDGLGPVGDLDHSHREYMIKDSLCQRAQLLTLSILEGWNLYQNGRLF